MREPAAGEADLRVVVVADTLIARGSRRTLPGALYSLLADADLILHAGDVVSDVVLDDLQRFAPVHAVLGNNDTRPDGGLVDRLPERLQLDLAGVRVAMVHDSGPARGRPARLRRWFPDADLVVFGHSHIPWDSEEDGQVLFNPGSPTERRRQPHHTAGVLRLGGGAVRERRIIVLDPPDTLRTLEIVAPREHESPGGMK